MKIDHILIENFLGLRHLDIDCGPRMLVCGPNASGKSSVIDAIRFALLGEPGRARLKKDYRSLLPPGAKAGEVVVTVDGREVDRQLPSGNPRGPAWEAPPALEHVLDAPRFARLDPTERRRLLLAVTGTSITMDVIEGEARKRGLDLERFGAIRPVLRAGLDAAAQECARQATEARGAWRAVTGETYGQVKAATWSAAVEPPPPDELPAAELAVRVARIDHDDAQRALGALGAQRAQARKREGLEELAGRLPGLQEALLRAQVRHTDACDVLAELTLASSPPQGLILPCPACGVRLAYQSSPPTLSVATQHDMSGPAAHDGLPAARLAQQDTARDLARLESAVREAAAARDALAVLGEAPDEMIVEAREDAVRETAETLRLAEAHHLAAAERVRAAAQAGERTQAAMGHHAAVCAWSALADALGPDGIPAEILGRALGPALDRLEQHAAASGWGEAHIDRAMDLDLDERPYALLSESERWRVDAMLAVTLAELSGVGVVMLDRLDVLDLPARKQAIAWLGELDLQVIVAGTLKAPPDPAGWGVVWLGGAT